MNQINRLEETWSPNWDLGTQDEFNFFAESESTQKEPEARRTGWSLASKELLNRQGRIDARLDAGAASLGDLIKVFETLYVDGGNDE
ncbi:hypothetical protein [Pelagicoccus sp. SDUM812003]|uniref:hypothetical protein n=1 Tax=Pelagicoccus sp. SDUM812003 TaxID=3041267 RepID=UPI00280E6647|nr:hypothetical protein [Pelagicoccus sp. SDUM812003]MDQ8201934.1 hypothetical protein [Pelagicoccus sp. SDUM812003]